MDDDFINFISIFLKSKLDKWFGSIVAMCWRIYKILIKRLSFTPSDEHRGKNAVPVSTSSQPSYIFI